MAGGIPHGAVGAFIGVLIYSLICLVLVTLLVAMLWSYGERLTYVSLIAIFSMISTVFSIAQQIHYVISFKVIKQAVFDKAVKSLTVPSLGFCGAAQIVDVVLYWFQFYCYNVMALNVLFWAVTLYCGCYEVRVNWLGLCYERLPTISKIFAIIFPGLIIGVANVGPVINIAALDFILTNITSKYIRFSAIIQRLTISVFASLTIGSVLLFSILYKYITSRRILASHAARNGWWAYSSSTLSSTFNRKATRGSAHRSIYDRALLTRFTIGFVLLAVFEVVIILFSLFQTRNFAKTAAVGKPDFSVSGAITDIVLFIPGVAASLVTSLVFGTIKSPKQYSDLLLRCCGLRTTRPARKKQRRASVQLSDPAGGLEFQNLPSIPNSPAPSPSVRKENATVRPKPVDVELGSISAYAPTRAHTRNFSMPSPGSGNIQFSPMDSVDKRCS